MAALLCPSLYIEKPSETFQTKGSSNVHAWLCSTYSVPVASHSLKPFINQIVCGDAVDVLRKLPDESIDCVVTSPPYWALRDYGVRGQIGLETSIEEYLDKLMRVFEEVCRVLKPEGTCWVNLGDTYASKTKGTAKKHKKQGNLYDSLVEKASIPKLEVKETIPNKSLCLIPARFSMRMLNIGFLLRNEIIWHKPNAMPQSAKDRFTNDYEKIFFFTKNPRYYFKQQFEPLKSPERLKRRAFDPDNPKRKYASVPDKRVSNINPKTYEESRKRILKKGRNKRAVWSIATRAFHGNHFASYPPQLIETPIEAGCPEGGIVLDPFLGSGTTAVVAKELRRKFIGIELNQEYVQLAKERFGHS